MKNNFFHCCQNTVYRKRQKWCKSTFTNHKKDSLNFKLDTEIQFSESHIKIYPIVLVWSFDNRQTNIQVIKRYDLSALIWDGQNVSTDEMKMTWHLKENVQFN